MTELEFDFVAAMVAGLVGAVAMMAARMMMKAAGVPLRMDVTRIWGTMFGVHGPPGRALGVAIHFVVSVLIALGYALFFELLDAEGSLWLWGLLGGLIHWFVAGLMMIVLPVAHPEIPEEREEPGAFIKNFGTSDVIGFLVGHLVFGVVVAIVYAWVAADLELAF